MCEIAIIDPDKYSPHEIKGIAMELYESMRSSLGVVAVHDNDGKFDYDIYKAVEPDRDDLLDFIEEVDESGANRVIIHGRLKTHGANTKEHAHPLKVDCEECNIDYVLHNGVIGGYDYAKEQHEQVGHEYNTEVDSEIIAHDFGKVPESFDEGGLDLHERERAFILLNENAMFIHAARYRLSKQAEMSLYRRDFGPNSNADDYNRVIMTPAETE